MTPRPSHFSDKLHVETCAKCTTMGDRTVMVHGSELPGRSRGWYCLRHAEAMGYVGP